ncbi:MAG TPA: Ig-like domain-containing protein [Micromonosporaceae bacterium]
MRRLLALAAAVCSTLLVATGCQPGARWEGPGESGAPDDPPKVALSAPANGAKDVPTAAEITFAVSGTRDIRVSLVDAAGKAVEGSLRGDASAWLPATQLDYATTYTATVTATKASGQKAEAKSTFTTMAKPANLVDVTSFVGDDQVIGVGMPMIIEFGLNVPVERRAEVERRLFVRSDPPQEGVWHWYRNDIVHYRPRQYWQPGTKLDVRIATGGLWWGVKNWYGRHDLTIHASVGPATIMTVDNKTKLMTVTRDGTVLRTMPVSLGKPAAPSSSGQLLIISKDRTALFDSSTYGVPVNSPDGYRTKVEYAMRLTWGGEFIHAAPWSVADQGRRNVSHGCVNISTANAKWLFNTVTVGDPVIIKGTEVHVTWGNGWTDWDRPWAEYVKGSALPYPPPGTAAPSTAGSLSPTPAPSGS